MFEKSEKRFFLGIEFMGVGSTFMLFMLHADCRRNGLIGKTSFFLKNKIIIMTLKNDITPFTINKQYFYI